jgi:hypothetical protein
LITKIDRLIQLLGFVDRKKHEGSGSCRNKIIPSSHKKIPPIHEKFRVLPEVEVEDVVGSVMRRARNGHLKKLTSKPLIGDKKLTNIFLVSRGVNHIDLY